MPPSSPRRSGARAQRARRSAQARRDVQADVLAALAFIVRAWPAFEGHADCGLLARSAAEAVQDGAELAEAVAGAAAEFAHADDEQPGSAEGRLLRACLACLPAAVQAAAGADLPEPGSVTRPEARRLLRDLFFRFRASVDFDGDRELVSEQLSAWPGPDAGLRLRDPAWRLRVIQPGYMEAEPEATFMYFESFEEAREAAVAEVKLTSEALWDGGSPERARQCQAARDEAAAEAGRLAEPGGTVTVGAWEHIIEPLS